MLCPKCGKKVNGEPIRCSWCGNQLVGSNGKPKTSQYTRTFVGELSETSIGKSDLPAEKNIFAIISCGLSAVAVAFCFVSIFLAIAMGIISASVTIASGSAGVLAALFGIIGLLYSSKLSGKAGIAQSGLGIGIGLVSILISSMLFINGSAREEVEFDVPQRDYNEIVTENMANETEVEIEIIN